MSTQNDKIKHNGDDRNKDVHGLKSLWKTDINEVDLLCVFMELGFRKGLLLLWLLFR